MNNFSSRLDKFALKLYKLYSFINADDPLVPSAGALQFVRQARQAGVNVLTVTFPWADHSINLQYYSAPNQAMLQIMLQLFRRYGR